MFGGGKDPALLAAMTTPLMLYHPIELLMGSAVVPRLLLAEEYPAHSYAAAGAVGVFYTTTYKTD
eukprot:4775-Heterococcus_DN1.PRE.1